MQLCGLVDDGLSTRKIAAKLGVSQITVRYWLKKYGLATKKLTYRCKCCGEINADKFMNKGGGRKSKTLCKVCHNKKTVDRFRARKLRAIEYKGGGKCVRCGYEQCPGSMAFHHKDPSQKDDSFDANFIKRTDWETVKQELDKCDLLCANCHGEVHWNNGLMV